MTMMIDDNDNELNAATSSASVIGLSQIKREIIKVLKLGEGRTTALTQ